MTIKSLIAVLLTLFGATAQGVTLEEVLEKHADAMGGLAKLSAVSSAVIRSETEVGGMKGTTVTYFKSPDKIRVELVLPIITYTQACNGNECWIRDQQGLTHSMSGDLKGLVVTQLALDRGTYLAPATFDGEIQLLDEPVEVEGKSCYQVVISPTGGTTATAAIDRESYLIKRVKLVTDMATVFAYPSDYRNVDGIMIPFQSTEATDAGIIAGINRVQRDEYNTAVSDS